MICKSSSHVIHFENLNLCVMHLAQANTKNLKVKKSQTYQTRSADNLMIYNNAVLKILEENFEVLLCSTNLML